MAESESTIAQRPTAEVPTKEENQAAAEQAAERSKPKAVDDEEDVPIPEIEESLKENRYDMEFPYVPLDAMNPAPYNPRKMTPEALSALAASLDEHGLVQPLIWNKRTGNLVGGHQRYRILKQRGVKEIKTCVVDVDEVDERALNITLNNPEVQGTFDGATLRKLLGSIKNAKSKNQYKRSGLEALETNLDLFEGGVKKAEPKAEEQTEPDSRDLSYIAPSLRLLAVPINSLKPDPNNARVHDDRNRMAVRNSLARFGQIRPIVTYKKVVMAGNCTWEEMKALGREYVAAMPADHLSVGEIVAYGLVDNKSASLASTDDKKLSTVLRALDDGWQELLPFTGFAGYEATAAIAGKSSPIPMTQTIPIDRVKPHPRNYRQHPQDQMDQLVESVKSFGVYRALIVANDDVLLSGHGLLEAARQAGLPEVPIVRLDLASDDPMALKVLAADNEISRLSESDDRQLTELLKEVMGSGDEGLKGTGFDRMMLANLALVTRPAAEMKGMSDAAQWVGMPEYDDGQNPFQLAISFQDEDGRTAFIAQNELGLVRGKAGGRVWSASWPATEIRDTAAIRFEQKDGEADQEQGA